MAGAGARGMLGVAFGITPEAPEFVALREEFFVNYETRMLLNTASSTAWPNWSKRLRAHGLRWGVVTNKSMRFTDPLTRAMPLFATARRSSAATPRPSPSRIPDRCSKPRGGSASTPARCVYVGDDERDIVAGRAAGMRTVAATYGYMGDAGRRHTLASRRGDRFAPGTLAMAE